LKNLYRRHYNHTFPKQSYDIESLTFLDFAKQTGGTLTVVATNLNMQQPVFFSVIDTPHQCIWTAIQASMTIPGLFQPVSIQGDLYVDGYISCVYPVPHSVELPPAHTLSVVIPIGSYITPKRAPISSFADYIKTLMVMVAFYNDEFIRILPAIPHLLLLSSPPLGPFPIDLGHDGFTISVSPDNIDASIAYGYEKMYDFSKTRLNNEAP
jgi:predicted acylesterase/phospholipase RssA